MRAIVLSGGGAKGAYEIGVWSALKKLKIKYDIVTGTSVGALNGAFMVQGDYLKALYMWKNINFDMIYGQKLNSDINSYEGIKELIKMYAKGISNGGMDVSKLEETVNKYISPTKFYNSKIDFGMVTVNLNNLKPIEIVKKNIPKDKIKDYLMASATCFPAFKIKDIDGSSYIDGGYYDNMPVSLAISMGATEIIAVDISGKSIIPRKEKKFDIPITVIKPKNDIGSFLVFDKTLATRNIKLGYNDTMKLYGKLEGNLYTFKKGEIEKIIKTNRENICKALTKIYTDFNEDSILVRDLKKVKWYKNLINDENKLDKELKDIIEILATYLEIDETKIYTARKYKKEIIKQYDKVPDLSIKELKKSINTNKVNDLFDQKIVIKYFYQIISDEFLKYTFPLENIFLSALLLDSIISKRK